MTGNPEVISSPVGLVPRNAVVLTGLANFRVSVTVGWEMPSTLTKTVPA